MYEHILGSTENIYLPARNAHKDAWTSDAVQFHTCIIRRIRYMKDNISSWSQNFILPLRHIFSPLLTFTFEICSICGWMWAQRFENSIATSACENVHNVVVPLDCSTIEASAYRSGRSSKWALKRPHLHIHLQEMWIVPVIIYFQHFYCWFRSGNLFCVFFGYLLIHRP